MSTTTQTTQTTPSPAIVKFGINYLFKQTPVIANRIAGATLYLAAAGMIIMHIFTEIPPAIQNAAAKLMLEIVTAVHLLCNTFGLHPQQPDDSTPTTK